MQVEVRDQMGREVSLTPFPKRIISLVPSQTELLYYLGLKDRLVGITKFCIHPSDALKENVIVGGTKKIRTQKVKELQPDLVIGNKEENTQDIVLELEQFCPVWMSDINTYKDALVMISELGELMNVGDKADELAKAIDRQFSEISTVNKLKVLYFIWYNPYMVAGSNTFVDSILQKAGYQNAAAHLERYPRLSESEIMEMDVDVVMLSSEPYPFKESHKEGLQNLLPKAEITLVDGEYFSWYGPRLLDTPNYLNSLNSFY
ncbi:MAG: helical backbone metal receptor [Bacteroidota bacterium]